MIQRPTLSFQSGDGWLEAKEPGGRWMRAEAEWYEKRTQFRIRCTTETAVCTVSESKPVYRRCKC